MRSLDEWLALQESVHPQSIDMGLARVAQVARALGLATPTCPVITVGGTNGKGSTAAHLEAILAAAGYRTGLFTSPHFLRYNERIRVSGAEVADAELIRAFEAIERGRGSTTLTFFEYNTLAALAVFAQRAVDVAILEVGLGGRLDATNLVDADVAVVCSVGMDHRDYLGDSLEQIGREKAGIFRSGRAAVLGTPDMPASVYRELASLGARAVIAEQDFHFRHSGGARWEYRGLRLHLEDLPPSALEGSIQYRNAATAIAAIESLPSPPPLDATTLGRALPAVRLAGRFQISMRDGVEWILDIAHNEPAARTLARHVHERPARRTLAVVGILGDKDAPAIAAALGRLVDHWVLCSLPGPRGTSADELAARLALPIAMTTLANSVDAGCAAAGSMARAGDRVLVFGSVLTVGPALRWLRIY